MSASQNPLAYPGSIPEPSAPPMDANHGGLAHLSYDQVVHWWNALPLEQRDKIQDEGEKLSLNHLAELRKDYKKNYPKEYYPKEIYSPNQFSACDYYLMYYFCDEMALQYQWFNPALLQTLQDVPPPGHNDPRPPSYQEANRWWESLSEQQKQNLQRRNFEPERIVIIRREYRPYYRSYCLNPGYFNGPHLYPYDFYLMCRYPNHLYGYPFFYDDYLFFNSFRTSIELTRLAIEGTYYGTRFVGNALINLGSTLGSGLRNAGNFFGTIGSNAMSSSSSRTSSSSDKHKDAQTILVGIAIIMGTLLSAASAAVASVYVGIKSAASIANLAQGKKLVRSSWRLGCMAAGAYVGAVEGAALGALVGSLIPGLGTAAGTIIGMIFGTPILAALGVAIAKYSAQFVAWRRTGSTNPAKWDTQETARTLYADKGRFSMNTAELTQLFTELRDQKNTFKTVKGALRGTDDNKEKNQYNKFLDAIKSGLDPREGIRVDAEVRFSWNSERHTIEKQAIPLPLPLGLKY